MFQSQCASFLSSFFFYFFSPPPLHYAWLCSICLASGRILNPVRTEVAYQPMPFNPKRYNLNWSCRSCLSVSNAHSRGWWTRKAWSMRSADKLYRQKLFSKLSPNFGNAVSSDLFCELTRTRTRLKILTLPLNMRKRLWPLKTGSFASQLQHFLKSGCISMNLTRVGKWTVCWHMGWGRKKTDKDKRKRTKAEVKWWRNRNSNG